VVPARRPLRLLLPAALLLLPAVARADDPEDAVRAWLREGDPKKRDALYEKRLKRHEGLDPEAITRVLAAAFPGEETKAGFAHGVKFRSHGEEWTYSVKIPPGAGKGLRPLVMDPGHGSFADAKEKDVEQAMENWLNVSGAQGQVIYLRTNVLDRLSKDRRYDEWSTPRRPPGKPGTDTIAGILLDAIRDASLRYPVDPDRIYVEGLSQTGYWAWWLGAFAPDRLAGTAPMSAVTWHVRKLLPSMRMLPVFVLHGTADTVCAFAQAKGAVDDLKALGAPVEPFFEEGGEHVARTWMRWGEAWPKMAAVKRNPAPKRIERLLVSGERPFCAWLSAEGFPKGEFNPFAPPVRLAGTIEGQEVRVEASGVDAVTVHLGPGLVDLSKPVTVLLGGKKAWEGVPKCSLRTALESVRLRADPAAAWPAEVRLKVP